MTAYTVYMYKCKSKKIKIWGWIWYLVPGAPGFPGILPRMSFFGVTVSVKISRLFVFFE